MPRQRDALDSDLSRYLQAALDADEPTEKNYCIRQALQHAILVADRDFDGAAEDLATPLGDE